MADASAFPPGAPCWVDLAAAEPERARAFYSVVLGWDHAPPDGDGRARASAAGGNVAAIGRRADNEPVGWSLRFCVADAGASLDDIVTAGGGYAARPVTIADEGRLAIASDPGGAMFGVWQPDGHNGFALVGPPGTPIWFELATRAFDDASAFYAEVFGYTYEALTTPGGSRYHVIQLGGVPIGGILEIGDTWPDGMGEGWVTYFASGDPDAAAGATEALDGHVIVPPFDSPYGRIAALADAEGAIFMIMRPTMPPD